MKVRYIHEGMFSSDCWCFFREVDGLRDFVYRGYLRKGMFYLYPKCSTVGARARGGKVVINELEVGHEFDHELDSM